jgi:hypothetical protein
MARAALGWSHIETAERAKLGVSTIRRSEAYDGLSGMTHVNREALERTFTEAGIVFTGDADAPGVQLIIKTT